MSGSTPVAVSSGSYSEALELMSDVAAVYGYKANTFAVINTDNEFDLLVVEVNNEFKNSGNSAVVELYTTAAGDISGATYTATNVTAETVTDNNSTSYDGTLAATFSKTSGIAWGESVTVNYTLSKAVPASSKAVITLSDGTVTEIAANGTTGSVTISVKGNITVTSATIEAAS